MHVLLRQIELFLRLTRMPATKFGRLAANDPRLVLDLRLGRVAGDIMKFRIEHFMNTHKPELPERPRRGRKPGTAPRPVLTLRTATIAKEQHHAF